MVGLGRRQHAGGLVEDQRLGAAIERLQDLDPLLQPDGKVADDGVLWLFYDGPSEGKAGNICARIADSLPERGFSVTTGGDDVVSWVRAERA